MLLSFACAVDAQTEGDVYPWVFDINGDGFVTFSDWQRIAFNALGYSTPVDQTQFAAMDCAPKSTLGDGIISAADVVQALNWSVGLDPDIRSSVGGSTNYTARSPLLGGPRTISITFSNFVRGQEQPLTVDLDGLGGETGMGFTVNFNPTQLRLIASSNYLSSFYDYQINTNDAVNGHVAVLLLSFPSLPPGKSPLLMLSFIAQGYGTAAITFGDLPTFREVVDTNALALPCNFTDAAIGIVGAPATVSVVGWQAGGLQLSLSGSALSNYALDTSTNLINWTTLNVVSNATGTVLFKDVTATNGLSRFYRARSVP